MNFFITFEGIEGCGKTTQIKRLASTLHEQGHTVVLTREPGGCSIADQVRAILLDAENRAMVPLTELLLYAAARAQHVAEVVSPALSSERIVLCDRFTDATLAYQGYGRGLDRNLLRRLNRLATGGITPDLTILMDCPVATGLARATARISKTKGDREERFELESLQFHERIRHGYLRLAQREPGRFLVIDGSRGIDETAGEIGRAVLARLPGH
jgi:dTMP kinase